MCADFSVHRDEIVQTITSTDGFSLPTKVLSTAPIMQSGSVMYDADTAVPYISDGTQWLPFNGLGDNEFVFSTSLPADNRNIFTDWTVLYERLQQITTVPKTIYIDAIFAAPAIIPAGSYDLIGTRVKALHLNDGQQDNLRVLPGVTIDNAFYWEDISVDFFGTTAEVMTIPFTAQTGFSSLSLVRSSFNSTTCVVPPIRVNGSGNIQLNKSGFQNFGGASALVTVDAGQTLGMATSASCIILDDNITGPGTCILSMDNSTFIDRTTQTVATLTIFLSRTYEKGAPGDWAGAATPISVKDALDRLAAQVAILSGFAVP